MSEDDMVWMLATLSHATPAAEAPAAPAANEDVRRYRNRFTGLGYVRSPSGADAFALRTFGLSAPEGGGIFARGGDIDLALSVDGAHTARFRTLFGINVVPGDRLRLAVYTGAGVQPSIPAVLSLTQGGDLDGPLVDAVVPVMADLGVSLGRSVGLHARGGVNLVPLSVAMSDGKVALGRRDRSIEAVVSASFGTRSGSRVRGFRIEAGRMNDAWSLLVGIGG